MLFLEAEEMAQQFRALNALPEDLSYFFCIHAGLFITTCNVYYPLLTSMEMWTYPHADTHITDN